MPSCKNCEKSIIWAETLNGKNMALDSISAKIEPEVRAGSLFVGGLRVYTVVKGKATLAIPNDMKLLRPLFTCHWDKCKS